MRVAGMPSNITVDAPARWRLGPGMGLGIAAAAAVVGAISYRWVVQPWHSRWGATDDEGARWMPGDELLGEASSTTRGVTIAAAPIEVWPWLLQIGYGKAGWYSYDWIDNDGRPSADRIMPTPIVGRPSGRLQPCPRPLPPPN